MQLTKSILASILFITVVMLPQSGWAQTGEITGTVSDSLSGESLPGVNVVIAGTQIGTATGPDGSFTISGVEAGTHDLQASFIGYVTKRIQGVQVEAGETTVVDIRLVPGAIELDEVVAVAYGVQQRQAVTGAVSNIDLNQLEGRPLSSVDQALEGQIAGVTVLNRSGIPGGGPSIKVRGTGNVGAGGEPLYVIDGFALPQPESEGNIARQNPLAEIPPDDIESITLLKDASATAIYGSRAANGVVLVTTKGGQAGPLAFTLSASSGWNTPWARDVPDMANAREFAEFQHFIWADRVAQGAADEIPAEYRDPSAYGEGTDWFDEILRTSRRHDVHLSGAGGTDQLRSYFSLGYTRDEGLMHAHNFNRVSARANIGADLTDRLAIGLNLAPSYTQRSLNFGGTDRGSGGGAPWRLCPLESPDEIQPGVNCTGVWSDANPVEFLKQVQDDTRTLRAVSSAYVDYEFIAGLRARSQFNVDFRNSNINFFNPSTVGGTNTPPPDVPVGNIETDRYLNWLSETTMNWQSDLGPGAIDMLGGFTLQQQTNNGSLFSGEFPGDAIRTFNVATQIDGGSTESEWSLMSWLGRINYNLADKYVFTGTIRSDGSSRFGADNRWATFPSAAVAWNLHNEPLMQTVSDVQQLRLRLSYGETGNLQIGNYASLGVVGDTEYVLDGDAAAGRFLATMGNSALSWEKSQEFNLGIDAVLYDRLDMAVDVYQRNTTQLLIDRELPMVAGFPSVTENTGKVRNRGVEVSMNSANVNRENFRWNSTVTFALNQNEIVSLPGGNDIRYTTWPAEYIHREGLPMATYVGFVVDGIYTSQEQIDNTASFAGAVPGTMIWRDLNGDGVLTEDVMDPEGDYAILGDAFPDFNFSLQNSVSIGRFDIRALINGEFGTTNLRTEWITTPRNIDGLFNVDSDYVKNFWRSPQQPGDGLTPTPIGGAAPRQQYRDTQHTMFLWDASHIWLRSLTVRYNLAGRLAGTSIYASGSNLFVISPYPSNPQATDLNDASNSPGRDDGNYPLPKQFTFGVDVSF